MSVIAKMTINDVLEFGPTNLLKLSCVYEHDGLNAAGYEDRRFTTATPWGEGDLGTPHVNGFEKGAAVYLVFNREDEGYEPREDCQLAMKVRVGYVETWPGTKHIQFTKDRRDEGNPSAALNLRLAIDNPAASDQFAEGSTYLMAIYRADQTTLAEAVAGA